MKDDIKQFLDENNINYGKIVEHDSQSITFDWISGEISYNAVNLLEELFHCRLMAWNHEKDKLTNVEFELTGKEL